MSEIIEGVVIDSEKAAKAITAAAVVPPARSPEAARSQVVDPDEVEALRERAEAEIEQSYATDAAAPLLVAAVVAVLAAPPFVVVSVAGAAVMVTAAVGVALVVGGPVLGAAMAAARLVSPELGDDAARDALAGMLRVLRSSMTRALVEEAERSVRDALAASSGGSNAEVGKAVRDALDPDSPAWRAHVQRVAVTTATAAVNEGVSIGAADLAASTGTRLGLRWVTMRDDAVRPSHRAADGQTVAIGQRFSVGVAQLRWPGDPLGPDDETANCRCVVLPTILT